jgi:hypothetical protein
MKSPPAVADPELTRPIETTLAAYRGLLPPEDLAEMRELLEDALGAHPIAALLRRRLGPASPPATTEESTVEGASPSIEQSKRSASGDD